MVSLVRKSVSEPRWWKRAALFVNGAIVTRAKPICSGLAQHAVVVRVGRVDDALEGEVPLSRLRHTAEGCCRDRHDGATAPRVSPLPAQPIPAPPRPASALSPPLPLAPTSTTTPFHGRGTRSGGTTPPPRRRRASRLGGGDGVAPESGEGEADRSGVAACAVRFTLKRGGAQATAAPGSTPPRAVAALATSTPRARRAARTAGKVPRSDVLSRGPKYLILCGRRMTCAPTDRTMTTRTQALENPALVPRKPRPGEARRAPPRHVFWLHPPARVLGTAPPGREDLARFTRPPLD